MPLVRRIGNRAASVALLAATGTWVPDTQNGMRLFRSERPGARSPLARGRLRRREPPPARAAVKSGREVESVEIPTIYDGEPSHYRPVIDTARVARALIGPGIGRRAAGGAHEAFAVLRAWAPRLGALILAVIALGAALPVVQPLDNALMLAVNGLGDGPEWLYQALDPHTRNYILLPRDHGDGGREPSAGRATCSAPRSAWCSRRTSPARPSRS